jgi:hypothetical protein
VIGVSDDGAFIAFCCLFLWSLLLFDFSFDQAIRLNNEQNTCMKTDKKEKEGKSGTTTQTTTDEVCPPPPPQQRKCSTCNNKKHNTKAFTISNTRKSPLFQE